MIIEQNIEKHWERSINPEVGILLFWYHFGVKLSKEKTFVYNTFTTKVPVKSNKCVIKIKKKLIFFR